MKNTKNLMSAPILVIIGLVLLFIAGNVIKNRIDFLNSSSIADGKVVEIIQGKSSDGNATYRPKISFVDQTGQEITFVSELTSNVFTYGIGEEVSVLYDKHNPQSAKINTFIQIWFAALIPLVIGLISFLAGLTVLISSKRRKDLKNRLLTSGTKVMAKIVSVELANLSKYSLAHKQKIMTAVLGQGLNTKFGAQQKYVIVAQWLNPADNQMYVYRSDEVAYNPEGLLPKNEIGVYIDLNNPEKYFMDISALPKSGN